MAAKSDVRKFIPAQYLEVVGKNLPAIFKAINTGAEYIEDLIQSCIDQLFLVTASGRFLVQLGEEKGFIMPANSGLDIRSYKVLVPIMVSDPKQVRISIDQLVQAFYGAARTKPLIQASTTGPYSLQVGDDLIMETENGISVVSIVSGQVANLNSVSAAEIAAIINSSQNLFSANAEKDRSTGIERLSLLSTTSGSGSFIRVVGGTLQNLLKFPNLVETTAEAGTVWNLTKSSSYTDELKFTWDGVGTNPSVFLAKANDSVTLRGFIDGVDPFSKLNGTFELVDVGYDYFIVRNSLFDDTSSTVTQPADNSIVFTKNEKITIFENNEFALTSEITPQTITLTVPAVPPLARRFLQGSAHVHGNKHPVLDFTRTTLQVSIGASEDRPIADNQAILANARQRFDFKKKKLKTTIVNSSLTEPTYNVSVNDDDFAFLPYTTPFVIGTNPIFATVDSDVYRLDFPIKHGLNYPWGFTLASLTGSSNILAGDLNKEQIVSSVIDDNSVEFKLRDSSGSPITFDGIAFGPYDVYRHSSEQSDGSDFYLEFGSTGNATASGLEQGMSFKLNPTGGTDIDVYYAGLLRFRTLTVVQQVGSKIHFIAGLGVGPQGKIIDDISGRRSSYIGGSSGTYFLDKTSTHNISNVMNNLEALFLAYTQPSNPDYLGSYVFDPQAVQTTLTVSKYTAKLTEGIFRGDTKTALMVDDVSPSPEEFPSGGGDLVIDYGTNSVEGPIRFFAFINNPGGRQILIDPAYKFQKTHDVSSTVQYVHQRLSYIPTTDGTDYPFYLTGTTQARNTLFALIELLIASGIFIEADVTLPNLRYADPSISPFE